MILSDKAIKEIAGNLDCGMVCYVHKETGEIKAMVDFDDYVIDEELWKDDIEEIEKNGDKYLMFEKMSSHEAFRLMKDFIYEVSNAKIRNRLIDALERRRPFQNFKYELGHDEAIRQQWFKFKVEKYEEYVRSHLRYLLSDEEE